MNDLLQYVKDVTGKLFKTKKQVKQQKQMDNKTMKKLIIAMEKLHKLKNDLRDHKIRIKEIEKQKMVETQKLVDAQQAMN